MLNHILNIQCELGEGIYYCTSHNSVFWVDIKQCKLMRRCLNTNKIHTYLMPSPIGWVKQNTQGEFLVGLQSGIYWLNEDFSCGEKVCSPPGEPQTNRLNDAKTDRQGRLYFGTMDNLEANPHGNLYQLSQSGATRNLKQIDNGYIVSNGPAVSRDGTLLYSVSSATREIFVFDIESSGAISNKRLFLTMPDGTGYPDGLTVDAADNLWVASWAGYGVCCFSPQGELLSRIILPAPLITNITFGGTHYDRMFITSARIGLSEQQLARYPLAGSVFELQSTFKGLPETPVDITR